VSAPRVVVVGDRNPANPTHVATDAALAHAGAEGVAWIPTPAVEAEPDVLRDVDGVLIAPGSPYASMDGALTAIRGARERGVPLVGT
jgi:CTP synthase (UTP-ammonia lyase)